MTVEDVVTNVEEGRKTFRGKGGHTRIVRNAGSAFVEYHAPNQPYAIETKFTDEFAEWAISAS